MTENGRIYADDVEYQRRFAIYQAASVKVDELNTNTDGVEYALNKYADWTPEEFKRLLGYKKANTTAAAIPALENAPLDSAPNAFDWCERGACTPVKDQAQCGSCWAFATTENIESVWHIKGRGLPVLAPQQIVDCDRNEYGCNGGDPRQAYMYVKNQGGIDTNAYYPYRAVQGACRFSAGAVAAKVTGEQDGYGGSEEQMAANLAAIAPFSIIVDAQSWQYYKGGVLPSSQCGKSLDHAVVAVGYNKEQGFWRVRNSWGAGWGESGFIRLQFNANTCGIQTEVLTATV
jgi:cathepsin H